VHWDFKIDQIVIGLSSGCNFVEFTSREHSPIVDFYQPRPEFEPSDLHRLKAKPAVLLFREGSAFKSAASLYIIRGEKVQPPEDALGVLWINERIEISWWCTSTEMAKLVRLSEVRMNASQTNLMRLNCSLTLLHGEYSITSDSKAHSRFLTGEGFAVFGPLSSYSLSVTSQQFG